MMHGKFSNPMIDGILSDRFSLIQIQRNQFLKAVEDFAKHPKEIAESTSGNNAPNEKNPVESIESPPENKNEIKVIEKKHSLFDFYSIKYNVS